MKYTLDRFEEDFAVLEAEDRTLLQVPKTDLPGNAAEGISFVLTDGRWQTAENEVNVQRIKAKMDALWK